VHDAKLKTAAMAAPKCQWGKRMHKLFMLEKLAPQAGCHAVMA
jgi:hypothetical protein